MLSWAHRRGVQAKELLVTIRTQLSMSGHTSTTTDANTSIKPYGLIVLYGAQTPNLYKFSQ